MTETELDDWRRTHYSNELISSSNEIDVIVMGWISCLAFIFQKSLICMS